MVKITVFITLIQKNMTDFIDQRFLINTKSINSHKLPHKIAIILEN